MSLFTGPLTITQLDVDWKLWQLEHDLVYEVGDKGSGKVISVPVGFITDGASIPQFLWSILPTWGTYSRAAVIHDFLYYCLRKGVPHPLAPDRKTADNIFLEAMAVCGVTVPVRNTIYAAVRTFGGYVLNNKKSVNDNSAVLVDVIGKD